MGEKAKKLPCLGKQGIWTMFPKHMENIRTCEFSQVDFLIPPIKDITTFAAKLSNFFLMICMCLLSQLTDISARKIYFEAGKTQRI